MTKAAGMITAAAFLSVFVFAVAFSVISVTVNEIVAEFSLSGTSEGFMSSFMSFGGLLALILAPFAQGRVNKAAMLVIAGAMQGIALIVCGVSGHFFLFCAACAFVGFGTNIADAYCNSIIADVHKAQSARYMGYLHGTYGIASLLAPIAIYALLQAMHWRGVYYVVAAVMLLSAAAVIILTRGSKGEPASSANETKIGKADLMEYVRQKRNMLLCLTGAFATAAQTGVLVWAVRYMALRFDAEAIGAASLTVFWVCATISRFFAVRIKIAPMRLIALGSVIGGACISAGVLSESAYFMCAMTGALGFAIGFIMPVLFSEGAKGYEGKTTLTSSALLLVMGVTRIAIPLLMAFFSAYVSVSLCMLLPAAFSVIAAIFGYWTERVSVRKSFG